MTRAETESLIQYITSLYPNSRLTKTQIDYMIRSWGKEFEDDDCHFVLEAFKEARRDEPDWMPTVPKIQEYMQRIHSRIKVKSKEQEFMDTHYGKSEEEWNALVSWENSTDGKEKIKAYKQRLFQIIGA